MIHPDIDTILNRMTLEEKAGQMTQLTLEAMLGPDKEALTEDIFDEALLQEAFSRYPVGSVLNKTHLPPTPEKWRAIVQQLQDQAATTRMKIPVIYGIDSTHGAGYVFGATLFPHQAGMAASWNPDLVKEAAAITASETRAAGLVWNFSPVMDLGLHPAWPRLYEGFGESPWLAARMGEAMVQGYQGEDIGQPHRVAACLKHFVGYGIPFTGQDRTPAYIPERLLRELHLPPFQAGIEAGAATIMINSGDVNGVPVHASRWLLTDILRDELGFEGLVVTDWQDIQYLHTRHRVAATQREAVKMALEAGIDMSMVPEDLSFPAFVVDLVKTGEIPESRVDESVRRILSLKAALGLLQDPLGAAATQDATFGSAAHKVVARNLARESITLLKNEHGVLPLASGSRVLLTGPTAHNRSALVGGWSHTWQGKTADEYLGAQVPTVWEELKARLGEGCHYVPGADFEVTIGVEEAVVQAEQADMIVCCLGEPSYTEFWGNTGDLNLPDAQIALAEAMLATGKPVVLLLLQGRPRVITRIARNAQAILMGYLPGEAGAAALVDILFGEAEPGGRLPFTYPSGPNAIEGLHAVAAEYTMPQGAPAPYAPLFPFGHGLSYTRFAYRVMALSDTTLEGDQVAQVTIRVENSGDRAGSEVVQLYLHDHYASVALPMRRLIRFEKIWLEPGEHRDVVFSINHRDLAFVNAAQTWVTEPGTFSLLCGGLSVEFSWKA